MFIQPAFLRPTQQMQPVMVNILFHSGRMPTGVLGLPGEANRTIETRYESVVTISGGLQGRFKGSIYPDNMNVKGRLLDGTYDVYLGFHKVGHPREHDLKVRTNGFRAVLVVNASRAVRVSSLSRHKQFSDGIHIHNGYHHWHAGHPMSEGCLTIAPNDWSRFLSLFLNAFPKISDWTTGSSRIGRRIGTVTVRSFIYNDLVPRRGILVA